MGIRSMTYVAFAAKDVEHYRRMAAWVDAKDHPFNFYSARVPDAGSGPEAVRGPEASRPEAVQGAAAVQGSAAGSTFAPTHGSGRAVATRAGLREELHHAKQAVLLASPAAKEEAADAFSFLAHELEAIVALHLPLVVVHLDGSRSGNPDNYPEALASVEYFTMDVAPYPAIVKYALDHYPSTFAERDCTGSFFYGEDVYHSLGL